MEKKFIFAEGAYFRSCHAITLAAGAEKLIAAWFAGTHEGHDDTAIWGAHWLGGRWSAPWRWVKISDEPHWNPVLFRLQNGNLRLFFKVGREIPDWRTWFADSTDDGITWSTAREMVPSDRSGGRGPAKNKPIRLSDGTILAPGSTEQNGCWRAFADCSQDEGVSWRMSFPPDNQWDVIQPTVWESAPGHVHMLLRSRSMRVCRSDSYDGGGSWSPVVQTDLVNNCCGLDAVYDSTSRRLFLVCNPGADMKIRSPLSLLFSDDNGMSWRKYCDLENEMVSVGDYKELTGGEFSYPAMIADGGMLHIGYTWHRRRMCVVSLPISIPDSDGGIGRERL